MDAVPSSSPSTPASVPASPDLNSTQISSGIPEMSATSTLRRTSQGKRGRKSSAEPPPLLPPPYIKLNGPDPLRIAQVSRTLSHEPSLMEMTDIALVDVGLDDATVASVVAPFVRQARALTRLDLSDNKALGREGGRAIGEALQHNALLQTLLMSGCPIGDEGAVAVSSALSVRASGYSSMAEVQLRRCGVGDEGGVAVARAVEGNKVIKTVNLSGNHLGDATASALGRSLSDPLCRLTTLSLSNNRITGRGLEPLAEALADRSCSLTALHLDGNRALGDEGLSALARCLLTNTNLRTLSTCGCGVGDMGAGAVAAAIAENFGLCTLLLRQNEIRDQGADALWRGLEQNRCLAVLDVSRNLFRAHGVKLLATVLQRNHFLRVLRVENNAIGNEGASSIAQGVQANQGLRELDLSRCEVDRPGAEALVRSLASNNSLTRCHFNGNPCGDGQLRAALARSHLSLTEDYIDAMEVRVRAARSEWQERAASRLAKAELIDKFKAEQGIRDFEREDREAMATFDRELKLLGPDAKVDIPVSYGRADNVVTSVKCTCTTDLSEVRQRLEKVLLASELQYAFLSKTGVVISRAEESSRTVVWDCGPRLVLRPDAWINVKDEE